MVKVSCEGWSLLRRVAFLMAVGLAAGGAVAKDCSLGSLAGQSMFWSRLGFYPDPCRRGNDGKPVFDKTLTRETAACHRMMQDAGVKVHSSVLFSGWIGPDEYDYAHTDATLRHLFDAVPEAKYLPRVKLNPPMDWLKANPSEVFVYPDGPDDPEAVRVLIGSDEHDLRGGGTCSVRTSDGATKQKRAKISCQSFASARWRSDAAEALRRLVEHLNASPYADRIVGLHLAWGACGETCVWGRDSGNYGDMSRVFERAFRAWGGKGPVEPENEEVKRFTDHLNVSLAECFGKTVKDLMGRDFPVGIFYGYMLECHNAAYSGWLGYEELLKSPFVDFWAGPVSYRERGAGAAGGWLAPPSSVNLRKQWVDEIDIRTFRSAPNSGFGRCATAAETRTVLAREMCKCLSTDSLYWWMDLGGGWYDGPEMGQIVRELEAAARKIRSRRHESRADVLFVVDEDAMRRAPMQRKKFDAERTSLRQMFLSGMLIDIYRAADLRDLPVGRYKAVVSFNPTDSRYPDRTYVPDPARPLPDTKDWRRFFESAGCKAYADAPAAVYGDNRFVAVFPAERPESFTLNYRDDVPFADGIDLVKAEYAKHHRQITGKDPAPQAVTFAVDPSVSVSGKDAYTIRSEKAADAPAGRNSNNQTIKQSNNARVKVTGSNERSVWYGLYDLLERRGGCRWFWDGDVVPKKEAIDLSGLDVKEEARFEFRGIRYFAHRGLTRFQAEHWGPDDWKREIDWCLKRRLNVFMLRIGQDDLFQRAFPDVCAYPDPSTDLPGHGKGYDNRTLFWSLKFRGKLRQDIQRYAFARGLMVPEDFGTMTHWYSRTPEDFLEKVKPPFLPQATEGYSEKNGLVWDIRDPKWVDEYWKLTTTACEAYGQGRDQQLLHTIGLGERRCFKDRKDNHELKKFALRQFLDRAGRDYPRAKRLLAGWDFYFTWHPEEVQDLVAHLDPARDIIWDYEGDSTRDYRPEMLDIGGNNFTKWGVCNKFPYTFSVFLAFEDALDMRANYPLIESRQKIVQDDAKCVGYIFWPESSHTDTLLLRHFTANAWSKDAVPVAEVLSEFCRSRYGADAAVWQAIWEKALPMSYLRDWGGNYAKDTVKHMKWMSPDGSETANDHYNNADYWMKERRYPEAVAGAADVFRALARLDWKASAFTERDAIDLARMTGDRLTSALRDRLLRTYHAWKDGKDSSDEVVRRADAFKRAGALMADVLELHTDYSLAESFDRLNAVEPVRNPNFPRVLVENATCDYCFSHQYEAARHLYQPMIAEFADDIARRAQRGDRSRLGGYRDFARTRDELMYAKPLQAMRPTLPRTQENYVRVMKDFAALAADLTRVHSCSGNELLDPGLIAVTIR